MLRLIASRVRLIIFAMAGVACFILTRAIGPAYAVSGTNRNTSDWSAYNGQQNGDHYSSLAQIDRSNAAKLRTAWTFDPHEQGGLQTNPLIVGRMLFACSPSQKVFALDAGSGKMIWTFDPNSSSRQPTRGFSYWTDGKSSILFAGASTNLYALDPATGKLIASFADGGKLDLRKGLATGDYTNEFAALTTPGVIYRDMIIVGFRAPETEPALHGDIRAFDVHSGALRWSFHTIPLPGEYGYNTWPKDAWKTTGAANNWAGMALDEQRGIVYVPTGSAVNDFYGFDRFGDNLFANTLLALDANTGKRIWHFQGVHHDIWDRDFPSPPALVTVRRNGKTIDAIAQTTKQGFVYLFNRADGTPLFPIKEFPFPSSNVPGEQASATQPLPVAPEPYARQRLSADMLTTRTPEAHAWAKKQFDTLRSDGQFVPLSIDKQTVVFPGFDGGAEWGGPAVDPETGVIYINSNDIAWTGGLIKERADGVGSTIYQQQCAICHGADRTGAPPAFPSLIEIDKRLDDAALAEVIHNGKGRMPGSPDITGSRMAALIEYLKSGDAPPSIERSTTSGSGKSEAMASTSAAPAKYHFTGYRKFVDPDGYPAIVPPWGTLNAIDLNTGEYRWKVPLGEYPELAATGLKNTGTENYGGPIVTAGGLVIIASTIYDRKIRAFNSATGEVLWQADLPYAGNATPATYMVDGKQYIVIATSGARDPKGPQGAAYVAFSLP